MDKRILASKLNELLSSIFVMYHKTHTFHWNVTGPNFIQYHEFFGKTYEELHDSVDVYAEHIRALGAFVNVTLQTYVTNSHVTEDLTIPDSDAMFTILYGDNIKIISLLKEVRKVAESIEEYGVVNFIEGQIDYHDKLGWMIKSFI